MHTAKAPGERIEARCTRCQDITGHIIVALVDGAIVKVECCACGSVHKYHPAKTAGSGGTRRVAGSGKTSSTASPHAHEVKSGRDVIAAEQAWRKAMECPSLPQPRPYATTMTLAVNDVVEHAVFGLGVVTSCIKPDKALIIFCDGSRTMRCVC